MEQLISSNPDMQMMVIEAIESMPLPSWCIYLFRIFHSSLVQYQLRKGELVMNNQCNAKYGEWAQWTQCSVSCTGGMKHRYRQ